jgi:hypothetical protein
MIALDDLGEERKKAVSICIIRVDGSDTLLKPTSVRQQDNCTTHGSDRMTETRAV